MAERLALVDLNMGTTAKVINLPTPTNGGDATNKTYVDGRTPKITVGATAPSSPAVGDLWVDTN